MSGRAGKRGKRPGVWAGIACWGPGRGTQSNLCRRRARISLFSHGQATSRTCARPKAKSRKASKQGPANEACPSRLGHTRHTAGPRPVGALFRAPSVWGWMEWMHVRWPSPSLPLPLHSLHPPTPRPARPNAAAMRMDVGPGGRGADQAHSQRRPLMSGPLELGQQHRKAVPFGRTSLPYLDPASPAARMGGEGKRRAGV